MLEKLPDVIGHVLRDQRAGLDLTAHRRVDLRGGAGAIRVSSLGFVDHGPLPALYTADGDGRSPPLAWTGVPPAASQVVLIVEDADAPTPQPLVHAIVVGLAPGDGALAEGALSESHGEPEAALAPGDTWHTGRNSFLGTHWLPPDPPPGHGVHRYVFQLFVLEAGADFGETPGRDEVLQAIAEHGLASGWLVGTYERPDTAIREGAADTSAVPVSGTAPA